MVKNLPANAGDVGDPWSGRSPGRGNGNPLQYSCLGNPIDRGAWWATIQKGHKESIMTDHILILVIVLIASTSNKIMKQPCKGLLIKMEKATITSTQSILNFPPKSYLRLMDVVICLMKSIISLSFEAFTQSRGKKS